MGLALCVVLVPVDTDLVRRDVVAPLEGGGVAHEVTVFGGWEVSATVHPVVLGFGTDVVPVLFLVRVIRRQRPGTLDVSRKRGEVHVIDMNERTLT